MQDMDFAEIREEDRGVFHELAQAYYREGEDADTPPEVLEPFVGMMFDKVMCREISGCFVKDKDRYIGFALWAVDSEDFAFRTIPGFGTILEIGLIPACRSLGLGRELAEHIEDCLRGCEMTQCYVSAYGPAQGFWKSCGYRANGQKASSGLPIMVKRIG